MSPRDRDVLVRKETPPKGSAVPHEIPPEGTGVHEGEELRLIRERRPTPERISKLEAFKDDMLQRVPKIETNVQWLVERKKEELEEKRLEREAQFQAAQLRAQTETNQVGLEKVRLTSRARVIVAIVGAVSAIAGALIAKGVL